MNIYCEILLEFLLLNLETFSRKDCGLILSGCRETASAREFDRLLETLTARRLLEKSGRGKQARFRITADGRERLAVADPARHWNRRWDGKWRVLVYDMPVRHQKDRLRLWRALRAHKFGLMQRSVWIWPHAVSEMLHEMLDAHGIPDYFCGFEASRLFLCETSEVVTAAWNFAEITRRQQVYLQHLVARPALVKQAQGLAELANLARVERQAYQDAFALDPLLPRELWPKVYIGERVERRHRQFRSQLQQRARKLASP